MCGLSCGTCPTDYNCTPAGQCLLGCPAAKDCTGRVCGPDPVCGLNCGVCGTSQECDIASGQCVNLLCTPNSYLCNGQERRQCSADGKSTTPVETCPYGCSPSSCLPQCVSDAQCAAAEYCSAANKCVPDICPQGSNVCTGPNELSLCSANGSGYASQQSCENGCAANACLPPPTCTDAAKNGSETDVDCGGATCPKCGLGGKCTAASDCASGACLGGACVECSPGAGRCVSGTHETCNAQGTWQVEAACSGGTPVCCPNSCTPGVILVALGDRHGCLVRQDNTLWCWGSNTDGQLGIGAITPPKSTPVQVTNLPGTIKALSAGKGFTCAAVDNGTLFCWGRNTEGQLGDGTKNNILSPNIVFAGGFVSRVSCGREHTCAVRDGSIVCWGLNAWGNLGDGTTTDRLSPVQVMGLGAQALDVTAGDQHTCAILTGGQVSCWGANGDGQVGDGTPGGNKLFPVAITGVGSGVTSLAAAFDHTCAAKDDGSVWCWGYNTYGQVGDGSQNVRRIPVKAQNLPSAAVGLDIGEQYSCAVLASGEVRCWGRGQEGQLGDGTKVSHVLPAPTVAFGKQALTVSTGLQFACARLADGTLQCWGDNASGQFGNGTKISNPAPTPLSLCQLPFEGRLDAKIDD